jgi:hypothetical protein
MRSWIGLVIPLVVLSLTPGDLVVGADYEEETTFATSEVLPADLIQGEHHKVAGEVRADGLMYFFDISSDFGEFEAYGRLALQVRLGEIAALGELSEVSKVGVLADSAVRTALAPVGAVVEFVDKPVETIKGIPKGIGRMFQRVKGGVQDLKEERAAKKEEKARQEAEGGEESSDEPSDMDKAEVAVTGYAMDSLGVSAARRKWAGKLGVDPYSTNEVLQEAIGAVAKVDAAGSVGVKLVGIPKIPGVDYIQDVNQLVWSKDPDELKQLNGERMAAMGLSRVEMERFRGNPFYSSPGRRTRIVAALAGMEGVSGRDVPIEFAAEAESEEEALFQMATASFLEVFHKQEAALERIVPSRGIGIGMTADGRMILALPGDYFMWIKGIADAFDWFDGVAEREGASKKEFWTAGELSERCREEVEALGWEVHSNTRLK